MSETAALTIQLSLFAVVVLVAVGAGLVYVKTKQRHGGFVCLLFGLIALSMGESIYDATVRVLG